MYLTIIGKKSAEKVKELVSSNIDNSDIETFSSLYQFVTEANIRVIKVDRFIILQDALEGEDDLEVKVSKFSEFVLSRYPSARLVSISKKEEITRVLKRYFIDDIYTHLLVEKATPSLILELVTSNIKDIDKKYGYKLKDNSDDEVLVEDFVEKVDVKKVESKNTKEKKGWFSRIFKKGKGNDETKEVVNKNKTSTTSDVIQDGIEAEESISSSNEENNLSDEKEECGDNLKGILIDEKEEDVDNLNGFRRKEDEDNLNGINIDFNFDSDIGFGHFNFNNEIVETSNDNVNMNDLSDIGIEEVNDDSWGISELDYEDNTRLEDNLFVIEDNYDKEENDDKDIEIKIPSNISTFDKNIFSKELSLDIDLPKVSVPNDMDIKDVDLLVPDIDLEKEVETYEKSNIKVVEKVVEVEKHIKVGTSKRSNVIIITGDRRVGKTSLSLNLCKELAKSKSKNILYVDMDIKRKGSLLYLGFEAILDEDERVQNGLYLVKSEKALDYVTYVVKKSNFSALVSMFGLGGNNEDLYQMSTVLSVQKKYDLVVIDCPLENLPYIKDIIPISDIYILTLGDIQTLYNTFIDMMMSLSEKDILQVVRRGVFLLQGKEVSYDDFYENIDVIDTIFNISSFMETKNIDVQKEIDWLSLYT